jgi:hypothetical protein
MLMSKCFLSNLIFQIYKVFIKEPMTSPLFAPQKSKTLRHSRTKSKDEALNKVIIIFSLKLMYSLKYKVLEDKQKKIEENMSKENKNDEINGF